MTPQQRYYQKNKDRLLKEAKDRYYQTIDYQKERGRKYNQINKEIINKRRALLVKEKRRLDPSFRLRSNISRQIRSALNKGFSKNKQSFFKFISYSLLELINHLEKQFSYWMTWDNHGHFYPLKWDDNDSSTWTWQVDHIIPQSKLKYISMEDENFNKCWDLSNLRPLSAKENFHLGIDLIRRKNKI